MTKTSQTTKIAIAATIKAGEKVTHNHAEKIAVPQKNLSLVSLSKAICLTLKFHKVTLRLPSWNEFGSRARFKKIDLQIIQ